MLILHKLFLSSKVNLIPYNMTNVYFSIYDTDLYILCGCLMCKPFNIRLVPLYIVHHIIIFVNGYDDDDAVHE